MAAIRRADIDLDRKGAMLLFASYADFEDAPEAGRVAGEGIHPGTDRYAQDLRKSVATARRYLAWAREVGIIELTRRANRRKKLCDEYRLVLTIEAQERIGIVNPTEYKERIGDSARARRDTAKAARVRRGAQQDEPPPDGPGTGSDPEDDDQRSPWVSADDACQDDDYRSSGVSANSTGPDDAADPDYRSACVSANTSISAQMDPGLALTLDERTPYIDTPSISGLTDHELVDLCTDAAGSRARGPDQDQISGDVHREAPTAAAGGATASPAAPKLGPKRCEHGLAAGLRPDGEPRCPLCRRAARDEPDQPDGPSEPKTDATNALATAA